jgi:hypothetical protein
MKQGCQIESKSNRILLSNRMFLPKSNWIECKSNRMTFRFSIRFDLIQSGQKHFFRKALKFDSIKWKIHKHNHKRDCQIFLPSWWIITSKISVSPAGQGLFMTFRAVLYRIELFFDQIEWNSFYNLSIKNQIESKPIRFDSPAMKWPGLTHRR